MKASVPLLENWSLQRTDKYAPPEAAGLSLVAVGIVSGHPKHEDGEKIMTASVLSSSGRIIDTISEQRYKLGEPDPKWLEWLEENGMSLPDPDNPVKFMTGEK